MVSHANKSPSYNSINEPSHSNATSSNNENINVNRVRNEDVETAGSSNDHATTPLTTNRKSRFGALGRLRNLRKIPKKYWIPVLCFKGLALVVGLTYYYLNLKYGGGMNTTTIVPPILISSNK